ncbi:TPA: hypothetical protein VHE18_001623 [Streptococcus pyogenes]|nr:hypothetical protein [Streptococcus pyogenes]HEQ7371410.1 hypothetical protein [Streptococcus pyogenes]HEQ7474449.1 hypothetical protein [Streptococcus pyogenes]HEQ7646123.1 hypothetical protein [Streptococcus pyogenes]HER6562539.1 hypothetical protein [Streptococcus pyogenes]
MVTSRTYPEENLIKSTDLKYPITIDVTNNVFTKVLNTKGYVYLASGRWYNSSC